MIFTKLYKRENVYTVDTKKVISSSHPPYKQQQKDITIDGKLYFQVKTLFIYRLKDNQKGRIQPLLR